ncbi:MAG: hypothetical protein V2A72_05260, partial [Candidatus Omnitrophota bacterium]
QQSQQKQDLEQQQQKQKQDLDNQQQNQQGPQPQKAQQQQGLQPEPQAATFESKQKDSVAKKPTGKFLSEDPLQDEGAKADLVPFEEGMRQKGISRPVEDESPALAKEQAYKILENYQKNQRAYLENKKEQERKYFRAKVLKNW